MPNPFSLSLCSNGDFRMRLFLFFLFLPFLCHARSGYDEPWGKDASLATPKKTTEQMQSPSIFTKAADQIILFHQKFLSPIDGPRSSFRPTSSRYMQLAMKRYGFFKGYVMGCDRLLRENDEKWVYRKIKIDGIEYKYDPAVVDKCIR